MRILFCHDGPIKKDENGNFYGTAHNDSTFKRYYYIASELLVAMRVESVDAKEAKIKYSKIQSNPIEFVECPNLAGFISFFKNRISLKNEIIKQIQKSDFVVIRLPSLIGNVALKYSKLYKKKYLVEVVACQWDVYWFHSIKGKILAPIAYLNTRLKIKNADNVMYITRKFLQSRYPTNGQSYISPNVSIKKMENYKLERKLVRIGELKPTSKIRLASIGAINLKYKGHKYVLEAISSLISKGFDIEYYLIGGGNSSFIEAEIKKNRLTDNVKIMGSLPHSEVVDLLDEVDIYIQPSLAEAQGRSLIEAMSRGCLCICTDVGGMPELLGQDYIVPRKNSKEIAKKIEIFFKKNKEEISLDNYNKAQAYEASKVNNERKIIYNEVFCLNASDVE